MPKLFACAAVWSLLVAAAGAQTIPSNLHLVTTYTPIPAVIGGLAFDASGSTLYVNNITSGTVQALPVIRNASAQITGFGAATTIVSTVSSVDGGLDIDPAGVFFWTTWPSHTLGQQTPANVTAFAPLTGSGVPSSTGGFEFVPVWMPNFGEVLVSSYTGGGIYKITLAPNGSGNGTYTVVPGSATLFAATPVGGEGFTHIPSGPYTGDLLHVNYNTGVIYLLRTDPATGQATGQSDTIISGLSVPMDVAFDPITNDLFVSRYASSLNLHHFSGTLIGDYQTNRPEASLDANGVQATLLSGAVTTVALGQPVTVSFQSTLIGNPFDIVLSFVPEVPVAFASPNGQIVNLNVFNPLFFAFGGFGASFSPASIPLVLPPGTVTAQMAILDFGSPDGYRLSQAIQIDVLPCSYFENIDSTPGGVGNYPVGWSNGGGTHQWQSLSGPTPSTATGPDTGHGGAGRYMYCETSITGIGTFIMNVGSHAVSPGDHADFWYHMYGATTGTLQLQEETAPGVWTPIFILSGDQGNTWFHVQAPLFGTGGTSNLRFHYVSGGSFTGDAAIDDFGICQ